MKLRLSKSKRGAKPIEVTTRDTKVLATLADFGVLTTEQIFRLGYSSISRARKRLKLLWQHGLVKRNVKAIRMGEGSSQYLYSLTTKGTGLLGDKSIKPRLRLSLGDHGLKIIDFRVALTLATRHNQEGIRLIWKGTQSARFRVQVPESGRHAPIPVVPDGFFTISVQNRDFSYFLEVDRGSTDLKRIRSKISAYLTLWKSGEAAKRLQVRSFRVLWITTSENRLKSMLGALSSPNPAQSRLDIAQFTCFPRYSLHAPERLLGPIWSSVDQTGQTQQATLFPPHSLRSSRSHQVNH